jgi:hypothetical protein
VQLKAEFTEAGGVEPLRDDLQRRALLADEEHALALSQTLGDDVADRLTLAGARRTLQDEARPALGRQNRLLLAGVGIEDFERLLRTQVAI